MDKLRKNQPLNFDVNEEELEETESLEENFDITAGVDTTVRQGRSDTGPGCL